MSTTCHVVTVKDISEIETSKERCAAARSNTGESCKTGPMLLGHQDIQGRTLYVGPKVQTLLGFTNREIYAGGTRLWLNQIHPEDFSRVSQKFSALRDKDIPFDEEYRIRRKDGTWIRVHDCAGGTHEVNGIRCADGFISDITPRKQAEAELRSKTAFLEAQANSTIDGPLVVDRDGRRRLANERLAELFQMPPELMADPDDRKMLAYVVTTVKKGGAFRAKVESLYRHPSRRVATRSNGREE